MAQERRFIKPESVSICVLYDAADGRIALKHKVVVLPGGRKLDRGQIESRAFAIAGKAGLSVSNLKALHVATEDFRPGSFYKVELESVRLLEVGRRSKGTTTMTRPQQ
jgi:hypothetical protein